MSSDDKIPLLKEETSSESDTDSEVDEAEETFEHLKLQECQATVDDSVELESSDSLDRERDAENTNLPGNKQISSSRELREPRVPSSEVKCDPVPQNVGVYDLQKEAARAKQVGENADSEDPESTPTFSQSPPTSESPQRLIPPLIPPRKHDEIQRMLQEQSGSENSSTSDRQNTLSGIASIVTEVASYPGERDEAGVLQTGQPPDCATGLERQLSEASDSNIEEIPKDYEVPPSTPTSCTPTSYGDRPTVAQLQGEEADKVGPSLGIDISKQSGLEVKQLGLTGDTGRNVVDASGTSIGGLPEHTQGEDVPSSSELSTARLFSRFDDKLTQGEHHPKRNEEGLRKPEETENATIGLQRDEERIGFSDYEKGSPSHPRYEAGPSSGEKRIMGTFNPETKTGVKSIGSKTSHPLQSCEESKASSAQTGKKYWQKAGCLRSMQLSAKTSKYSAEPKEADPISPCMARSPELMETEDSESLEKMETNAEENDVTNPGLPELKPVDQAIRHEMEETSTDREEIFSEVNLSRKPGQLKGAHGGVAVSPRLPESKHPLKPGGQTTGRETEGTSTKEAVMSGRKGRKSKRPDEKLPNSPLSDENLGYSPKKAKPDVDLGTTRRTRHDSESSPSDASGDESTAM